MISFPDLKIIHHVQSKPSFENSLDLLEGPTGRAKNIFGLFLGSWVR